MKYFLTRNIWKRLQRGQGGKTSSAVSVSFVFIFKEYSNRQLSASSTRESITLIINEEGGDDKDVDPPRYAQWGDSLRCAHRGDISPAVLSTRWGKPSNGDHHYFMFYGF